MKSALHPKIPRNSAVFSSQKNGPSAPKALQYSYDIYRDGVTQGLLSQFLQCPEKHNLGTVQGYTSIRTSGALAFGSLVHDVLDIIYSTTAVSLEEGKQITYAHTEEWMREALAISLKRDWEHLSKNLSATIDVQQQMEYNYGLAEVLIRAYLHRWQKDIAGLDWEALELQFEIPYGLMDAHGKVSQSIPIRGKMDGVFRRGGKLWLFETKTKSRVEEDTFADSIGYNLQVCLYLWAVSAVFSEQPAGVLYNIIRKPQLRQGKNETLPIFLSRVEEDVATRPDFYFIRYECIIGKDEMSRWIGDFHGMMKSLVRWHEGGGEGHYRNPVACNMYGGCQFLRLCGRGEDTYLTKRDRPFPELAILEEE